MAVKKTGLGRGLDALFSTPVIEEEVKNKEIAQLVKINEIEPNKEQARKKVLIMEIKKIEKLFLNMMKKIFDLIESFKIKGSCPLNIK